MPRPMRTVSFKLPEQLDDELSRLAAARRTSRSDLVREAVTALAYGTGGSVTAAVDRLCDVGDGPSDLSSNPKYLRDYGR